MASARHDAGFARPRRDADEHRLETERSKPETHLIILGHAVAGERPSVLHRGELAKRAPGNCAADTGQRNRRADGFANNQLLDVGLGELVAIMPSDPAGMRVAKW